MKSLFLSFVLFCLANFSWAIDNTIRVSIYYAPNAANDLGYITSSVDQLETGWLRTGNFAGVSLSISLASSPFPVIESGPTSNILERAETDPNWQVWRHRYAADVVILFVDSDLTAPDSECGFANAQHWITESQTGTTEFIVTDRVNQLDLRGANDSYTAVVNVNCHVKTLMHELGHLLGAGHQDTTYHKWLYDDSHAYQWLYTTEDTTYIYNTALVFSSACVDSPGVICGHLAAYSENGGPYGGDAAHNNMRAVIKTARSVANFFRTVAVPPYLLPPKNVTGFLVSSCDPSPYTHHFVTWEEGGSTAEVDRFEVWYRQPPSDINFQYAGSTVVESTDVWVFGDDSLVYVRTCSEDLCTTLSDSSYLASFECNY